MFKTNIYRFLLPAFVVVAIGIVAWWLVYNPVRTFKSSVPGMDDRKTPFPTRRRR